MKFKKIAAVAAVTGSLASASALAMNAMMGEAYGPVSMGMGGASLAYDNGTAGMMSNPATLSLAAEGNRIDAVLGHVGPRIEAPGTLGKSSADSFYDPSIGYVRKAGHFAYGAGVWGQGGMGSEYATGDMSQLHVGRLVFPVAYSVSDRLNVGGSLDVVLADMDLVVGARGIRFNDGSSMTGEASGHGIAAKAGFTYKLADGVTLGAVYQTAGNLQDLKSGAYKVTGIDAPPVLGAGLAWQASAPLLLAFDVKNVMWSRVVNTVTVYHNGATVLTVPQNWEDQIVYAVGAAYKLDEAWTGRVGFNYGKNPVPSQFVGALWPAITEKHYTAGVEYKVDQRSSLNFAVSYVPEVTVAGTGPALPFGNGGLTITHSQLNWQAMYSYSF